MSIRNAEPIEFPPAYPNIFVQSLERSLVNGKVDYNADIISLAQEEMDWVNSRALTDMFDMDEFSMITDCYDILNDVNVDLIDIVQGDKKKEERFLCLDPDWLMEVCINTWEDEEGYYKTLEKSRDYLNENYIIESKVLIFPTEVFGSSERIKNAYQQTDYMALKFWQLTHKNYRDLKKEEKDFIRLPDSPIIVFMGIFKLNLSSGIYQIPSNIAQTYNPTGKTLRTNIYVKNYEKDNRLYLAVNRQYENKNNLDMSVIRRALKYHLVDGKIGIMNIDSITYDIKKL